MTVEHTSGKDDCKATGHVSIARKVEGILGMDHLLVGFVYIWGESAYPRALSGMCLVGQ